MNHRVFPAPPKTGQLFLTTLVLVLLSACGTRGGPFTPDTSPRPLDVSITLDESRAVTRTVPIAGGTVEVTSEDGTLYTLTIPGDALLAETEITVTPIVDVVGAPVEGGAPLGVHLQPEGLRFHRSVTLEVTPPGGTRQVEAASFRYSGNGKAFHGYPLALDPTSLRFDLLHFSGYVLYLGPTLGEGDYEQFMPSDPESQLEHRAQELVNAERDAQVRGESGDPQFAEKLEAILDSYFQKVIAPLLPLIESDCKAARAHSAEVLAWTRQTHLFGLQERFRSENAAIWNSIISGLENCWEETVQPCLDRANETQLTAAIVIARQLELMGAAPGQYDPFDPELGCVDLWSGTITYSETGSITRYSDDPETTGSWTNSYEHHQTIEVGSLSSSSDGSGAERSVTLYATGVVSEHGLFRKEHHDDCVASADPILRYVFENSSDYELTGELQTSEVAPNLYIAADSSYELIVPLIGFVIEGTRTTRSYYIDNCFPESETDDRTTEPWESAIDYGDPVTVTGSIQSEDPNHLSGSHEEEREQENGVPTTVVVTWNLVRKAE